MKKTDVEIVKNIFLNLGDKLMVSNREDLEKVVDQEFTKEVKKITRKPASIEDITVKYLQKLSKLLKDGAEVPTGMSVTQSIDAKGGSILTKVKINCSVLVQ